MKMVKIGRSSAMKRAELDSDKNKGRRISGEMLRSRKVPPFFKLTLVVLCAYILWSFNHSEQGDTHNLTVGLPLKDHWELGGYPAYIDKRLIDPPLPKYNILGHHFRFNIDKLKEIMPDDTRYITIIRSPVDNVESVFGFFQDQLPFIDWLEGVEANTAVRLNLFYDNPSKYYTTNTDWYFRAKNHMFFDIGYDVSKDDTDFIDAKIQEMDNIFTLVLLTDFFDESLIMMKNLLCWDWEDIVYIKFKMRTDDAKTEVKPALAKKILNWNKADTRLYDYFNKTFWRKVDEYGKEKMARDLESFEAKQKEAENLCIDSYQPFKKKPWILGAKLRKKPSPYCRNLAASETVYGERLREKMYASIPSLTPADDEARKNLFKQVAEGALQST